MHPFPATQARREEHASHLSAQDRSAILYWLKHSGVGRVERRRMATRILLASVFAQASLVGAVSCPGCGDRGCWRCQG